MNGLPTLLLLNNSNLKETKSKEVSVIKSTGKKVKISPSKPLKRKEKNKKKTVQKEVESFFNFFKEIDLTEDEEENNEEAE